MNYEKTTLPAVTGTQKLGALAVMRQPLLALQRRKLARQRGQGAFDLTELALYLVAGILLLIGIIALFTHVLTGTKEQNALSQFNTIATEIRSLYSNQSTYLSLTTTQIANVGGLASSWLVGTAPSATGILNPFKGSITVAVGDAAGASFYISEAGLPKEACVALATQDEGTSFVSETINGTAVTTVPGVGAATSSCSSNTSNAVAVYLN